MLLIIPLKSKNLSLQKIIVHRTISIQTRKQKKENYHFPWNHFSTLHFSLLSSSVHEHLGNFRLFREQKESPLNGGMSLRDENSDRGNKIFPGFFPACAHSGSHQTRISFSRLYMWAARAGQICVHNSIYKANGELFRPALSGSLLKLIHQTSAYRKKDSCGGMPNTRRRLYWIEFSCRQWTRKKVPEAEFRAEFWGRFWDWSIVVHWPDPSLNFRWRFDWRLFKDFEHKLMFNWSSLSPTDVHQFVIFYITEDLKKIYLL